MTLNELINEWLYEKHKIEIKERTLLRYECAIREHITNDVGLLDVDEITPRVMQKL